MLLDWRTLDLRVVAPACAKAMALKTGTDMQSCLLFLIPEQETAVMPAPPFPYSRSLALSLFLTHSLSLVVVIVALYFIESMLTITVAMNSDMAAALKAKLLEHWADVRHQLRQ